MKFFKRSLLVLLVLILLIPAALFIITHFYKKEIADALIKNLNDNFDLTLTVKEVDVSIFANFPQASVSLDNVMLDNKLHAASEPLLKAEKVKISFNLRKLLKKEFEINAIAVQTASINLVTNEDGTKNFEFKKKDTTVTAAKSGSGLDFNIKKISIDHTQFDFSNKARGQHIALNLSDEVIDMRRNPEGFDFTLKGEVEIGGLLFNPNKGAFLKNISAKLDLEGSLYTVNKTCFIREPSSIEIEDVRYPANVLVKLGEEKSLTLKISARELSYHKGLKLVNPKIAKILSNYSITKPMDLDLLLYTSLGKRQEPVILLKVKSDHNTVTIGHSKVTYNDVSFKGLILSLDSSLDKGNAEQAIVRFSQIRGNIYEVPFTASVLVKDFTRPQIAINAALSIDAQKVKLKASEEFDLKGYCVARVSYSGPAAKINKREFLSSDMKLKARLSFKNFSYKQKRRHSVFTINGKALVTNTDLSFNGLVLKTNGGELSLNGKVEHFTPYVLGLGNELKIHLEAYSNQFDLNPFMSVASKKTTNKESSQEPATEPAKKPAKASANAKSEAVKQLNNESVFDFNVSLRAKKMLIRKVVAEEVAMNLTYKNDLLNLKSVSMNTCGGKLKASGTIRNLQEINVSVKANDINVTTLFEEFENFGQQAIQSKHLKGKISLDAVFNAELDEKMEIVPYTMLGNVDLKLKEGHLLEYEPLQNVSNFIFHNRDFNDITFSEINERFRIKGYEMQIEELEIASNVVNLFVAGTYHFKSQSNINLVIPWSNLRKRGKNYIPKASGLAAEDAKGLKLNYSGEPKKMKLSIGHK
jgi:hypothetical protein